MGPREMFEQLREKMSRDDSKSMTDEEKREMDRLEKLLNGKVRLSKKEENELVTMFAGADIGELEQELEHFLSDEDRSANDVPASFEKCSVPSNYDDEWKKEKREINEAIGRDMTKEETDRRTLLKNNNVAFADHDPSEWLTEEYREIAGAKDVANRIFRMENPPTLKFDGRSYESVRDKGQEQIIMRGKNQLRLEGVEGAESSVGGGGRGRGRGNPNVNRGEISPSSTFGSLSSQGSSTADEYKNFPTVFFEDASEEANASILRLLHDVHIHDGVDAVVEGVRAAQAAMTPVIPNLAKDHRDYEKVLAMCETLEKNAHLDREYKAELVKMYEEELESPTDNLGEFGRPEYDGVLPTVKTDAKGFVGPDKSDTKSA